MTFLKELSNRYYNDARTLNYTWMDLVKKTTRQKVIDEVKRFQHIKMINKAEEDTIINKIRDKQFKQKLKKFNREHERIMKQQKPSTKIVPTEKALKGHVESFKISVINNKDPLSQLQNTRKAINNHIIKILASKKGLKFIETLKVTFNKQTKDRITQKTAYFNSKPQETTNNVMVVEALKLSKDQILNIIAQWISEGSGWTVESVDDHFLNIVEYTPLNGSSYIKLPSELNNPKKGLINLKNNDNECFRWCHIRSLNP